MRMLRVRSGRGGRAARPAPRAAGSSARPGMPRAAAWRAGAGPGGCAAGLAGTEPRAGFLASDLDNVVCTGKV